MLIDPPNKANAQENTKIFRARGSAPRPRACAAGAGASPQTTPGRYAPVTVRAENKKEVFI